MDAILAWLAGLGESDSVEGAVYVALASALLAVAGWFLKALWDASVARLKRVREKRAAFVRFYTFIKIRERNCKQVYTAANERAQLESLTSKSRLLVSIAKDADDYDVMLPYLGDLDYETLVSVRLLTEYDRSFLAQYQQVGSETFEKLTIDRKSTAIRNLYGAARDVIDAAGDATAHLSRIRYLAKLDKVITRRVEILESTRRPNPIRPAEEEVRSS